MCADIYNNGPLSTDFRIKLASRKDAEVQALNEEDEDEDEEKKDGEERPEGYHDEGAEWAAKALDTSVSCEPMEGFLGPYEKCRLTFTFTPDMVRWRQSRNI